MNGSLTITMPGHPQSWRAPSRHTPPTHPAGVRATVSSTTGKASVSAQRKSPLEQLVAAAAPEEATVPSYVFHVDAAFLNVAPNGVTHEYLEDLRRMASGGEEAAEAPEIIRGAAAASTTTPPDLTQLLAMQRLLALQTYRFYNPDDDSVDAALGHIRIPASTSTIEDQVSIANTITNTPGAEWSPAQASKPVMEKFLKDFIKHAAVIRRMNAVHASELYKDFDQLERLLKEAGKDDLAKLIPPMVERFTDDQALGLALYLQVPKMVMQNVDTPADFEAHGSNSKQLDQIQARMANVFSPADRQRLEILGATATAVSGASESKKKETKETKNKVKTPRALKKKKSKPLAKGGAGKDRLSNRPADKAAGGAAAGPKKGTTFKSPTKQSPKQGAGRARHPEGDREHKKPRHEVKNIDRASGGETPFHDSGGTYVKSPSGKGGKPKGKSKRSDKGKSKRN